MSLVHTEHARSKLETLHRKLSIIIVQENVIKKTRKSILIIALR